MVDEAVQATESMVREDWERMHVEEMRDRELRKAARRLDYQLDHAYMNEEAVADLRRGRFQQTPEYACTIMEHTSLLIYLI